MTEPQTFYAVMTEDEVVLPERYENADKAELIAQREARKWGTPHRVIAYTVIATYEGTDD